MQSALKKISSFELRLGMFVQKIGGSWLDHPFWKGSFLLDDDAALRTLRALPARDVWIDPARGLDVEPAPTPPAPASGKRDTAARSGARRVPRAVAEQVIAFEAEIGRATQIRDRARLEMMSLLGSARMGRALDLAAADAVVDEIGQSIARNNAAILSVLRLREKDDYTYLHSVAVCALMMALGRQLGIEGQQLLDLGLAGLLHDIGKVGVADEILNKPGRLTDEEFVAVKRHPQFGWDILSRQSDANPTALDVCLHHHEKCDGSGYPQQLSGSALSRAARMGAICDVYDAVTSDRSYKQAWQPAEAIRRMAEWQGGHFDRDIFHAFVKMIGIYPAGTLVRLASERIAVVLNQGEGSSLKPLVKVFYSLRFNAMVPPELLNLDQATDSIVAVEDPARWKFDIAVLLRN